jgi:anti-sigma B factor antagonist
VVVAVVGEVDMATAPELAEAFAAVNDSARRVIVDLTEATFLDSSALNALVHGQRELAKQQIEFRVVSPADKIVRRVFELTQLEASLGVVESLPDALAG